MLIYLSNEERKMLLKCKTISCTSLLRWKRANEFGLSANVASDAAATVCSDESYELVNTGIVVILFVG